MRDLRKGYFNYRGTALATRYRSRPRSFYNWAVPISLLLLSVPMGLSNQTSLILSCLLAIPFLCMAAGGIRHAVPLILLVVIDVATNAISDKDYIFPAFEFMRSVLPFFYAIVLLAGFTKASETFSAVVDRWPNKRHRLNLIVYCFVIGLLIQILLVYLGVHLANIAFNGVLDESGRPRIYLEQSSIAVILFYYAIKNQKPLLMIMTTLIVLSSGGKGMFFSMIAVSIVSFIKVRNIRHYIFMPVLLSIVGLLVVYFNPAVLARSLKFFGDDQIKDKSRESELSYALDLYRSGLRVQLIGVGLDGQITPGQHTIDPRWNENSKYDIESVYGALLVKTGAIGCAYIIFLFFRIKRSAMFMAIIAIEVVGGLGECTYFFMGFDGVYLLAWSIVLIKLENLGEEPNARIVRNRVRGVSSLQEST